MHIQSSRLRIMVSVLVILLASTYCTVYQASAQQANPHNQPEGEAPVIAQTLLSDQAPQYEILLKSREFTPDPGIDSGLLRATSELATAGQPRIHVYLQFYAAPSQAERDALLARGIQLLEYIPNYTWLASMPTGVTSDAVTQQSAGMLPGNGNIRWVGSISDVDKTEAQLASNNIGIWAKAPYLPDGVIVIVEFFRDIPLTSGASLVTSVGGRVVSQIPTINAVVAEIPSKSVSILAKQDAVMWIEAVEPALGAMNDGARTNTGVDIVQSAPYSLTGAGVTALIYDGGIVDGSHPDFTGRIVSIAPEEGDQVADHATHVAGTFGGDGRQSAANGGAANQWRGMAPGASIISDDYDPGHTDNPEFDPIFYNNPATIEEDYREAVVGNAGIANNSIGMNLCSNYVDTLPVSGDDGTAEFPERVQHYGDYETSAQLVDQVAFGNWTGERPFVLIYSAGNERSHSACNTIADPSNPGYHMIATPATSKNAIVIGAINSNDSSMTDFSSWGPVDDGRLKPDVVAPGCESETTGAGIHSTMPGSTYGDMCGTSMAAPVVTGVSALILEQFRVTYSFDPRPATYKAILAHTARDLGNRGPDYAYGYGAVNARSAIDLVRAQRVRTDQIENSRVHIYSIDVLAGSELKATLAWDDPAAVPLAARALVNDLDVSIVDPNGKVYYPWILDPAKPSTSARQDRPDNLNPIEQVLVPSSSVVGGRWHVRVTGRLVTGDPQAYSLVLQGGDVTSEVVVDLAEQGAIDNGVIRLGINAEGHLNIYGYESSSGGTDALGLRFLPTNAEATAPGCLCEGWGAGDAITEDGGYADIDVDGVQNIRKIDFVTGTNTSGAGYATSLVEIDDSTGTNPLLRVRHDYHESITEYLYEATVTIQNISNSATDIRYRRVMDWDVEPTAFWEYVTIDGGSAGSLLFASDDGFASANPFAGESSILFTGDAVDSGPEDHGALFDFGFGRIEPGQSVQFNIYYGAAPNENEALLAIDAVGAEVYSLGQPDTTDGPTMGTPNTFIFAFSSVGGAPIERLSMRKKADVGRSEQGTSNGYTLVATNPTTQTITLTSFHDDLPSTFAYRPGSTIGVTSNDPVIDGESLIWNGSFPILPSQSISLHFSVDIPVTSEVGGYYNEADGTAVNSAGAPVPVRSTGRVAKIDVFPPQLVSDISVTTPTGSVTVDPATGDISIAMPWGSRSDISISTSISCPTPPGGLPSSASLVFGANSYLMTENPPGSGLYAATIPSGDVESGAMLIEIICEGQTFVNSLGEVRLYDPSGIVSDAKSTLPVVGAIVTLYKVPGWLPDTSGETRDCRTLDTRGTDGWTQVAPVDLGVVVDPELEPAEIDPQINPQSTNAEGRYGWNVVIGCWFVRVDAPGYESAFSPVVGVPPEVTDLNIALEPSEVQFSSAVYSAPENAGQVAIPVTLSTPSIFTVTVEYATSNDVLGASVGQLIFAPGETAQSFMIAITDDLLDEADEVIQLLLRNPNNAMLGDPAAAMLTVLDDDPPPTVQFSSAAYSATENAGQIIVPVDLSTSSSFTVTVEYATGGDALGANAIGQLIFAPGETTQSLVIPVVDDTLDEADVVIPLILRTPVNATLGATAAATLTVVDDDPPPTVQFSSAAYSATENDGQIVIPVNLSAPSGFTVTVEYATGGDALGANAVGQLSFAPGETTQSFVIPITDDSLDAADVGIPLILRTPVNATLGATAAATLTVVDDDPPPTVQFSSATYSATENAGQVAIAVNLSAPSGFTVTVGYSSSNDAAQTGTENAATGGTLTYAPGETEKSFSVPILDDFGTQPDRRVNLVLSNPVNATLGELGAAVLTILDVIRTQSLYLPVISR